MIDDKKRFMQFIQVTPGSHCWEWSGRRHSDWGYGSFFMRSYDWPAHRASWFLYRGMIPEGKLVLHKCDNKMCVNPNHLYIGTHADNKRDAVERGLHACGIRHGSAKLTPELAKEIRHLYAEGFLLQKDLASRYGISKSQVWNIVHSRHWKSGKPPAAQVINLVNRLCEGIPPTDPGLMVARQMRILRSGPLTTAAALLDRTSGGISRCWVRAARAKADATCGVSPGAKSNGCLDKQPDNEPDCVWDYGAGWGIRPRGSMRRTR